MDREVPLTGGRTTVGVVRVGNTVRRLGAANSDLVERLLGYLAERGFDGAPAPLGRDDLGRDVVAYIEGDVPAELELHEDATPRSAAGLIRRFHDLGAQFVAAQQADAVEVVCHNDLSPCNFVFRRGVPIAIIDFAAAAPGTRFADRSYAGWMWLDVGSPDIAPAEQARRLRVFLDAYGERDASPVVAAMLMRQKQLADDAAPRNDVAMAQWAGDCLAWTRDNESILRSA